MPEDHEPFITTRAELRDNLLTARGIARRTGVEPAAVYNWAARYPDWPVPLLPAEERDIGLGQARWWWPDVRAFLDSRHLPARRGPRKKPRDA